MAAKVEFNIKRIAKTVSRYGKTYTVKLNMDKKSCSCVCRWRYHSSKYDAYYCVKYQWINTFGNKRMIAHDHCRGIDSAANQGGRR